MSREHKKINQRRWAFVRRAVLRRDKYRCQTCRKAGRLEVDHLTALHLDPLQDPFDLDGLQALCKSCHLEKTAKENKRRRVGPLGLSWQEFTAEIQG